MHRKGKWGFQKGVRARLRRLPCQSVTVRHVVGVQTLKVSDRLKHRLLQCMHGRMRRKCMQSMNAWTALSADHARMDCTDLQSRPRWTAGNDSPCMQSTTHGLRIPAVHRTLDCRRLASIHYGLQMSAVQETMDCNRKTWTACSCRQCLQSTNMDCIRMPSMITWTACLRSPYAHGLHAYAGHHAPGLQLTTPVAPNPICQMHEQSAPAACLRRLLYLLS